MTSDPSGSIVPKTYERLVVTICHRVPSYSLKSTPVYAELSKGICRYSSTMRTIFWNQGWPSRGEEAVGAEYPDQPPRVEVVLTSQKQCRYQLQLLISIEAHGLPIVGPSSRAVEHHGATANSELSCSCPLHPEDVEKPCPLASRQQRSCRTPHKTLATQSCVLPSIGDAVIFSDEAERIYQEQGLDKVTGPKQSKGSTVTQQPQTLLAGVACFAVAILR